MKTFKNLLENIPNSVYTERDVEFIAVLEEDLHGGNSLHVKSIEYRFKLLINDKVYKYRLSSSDELDEIDLESARSSFMEFLLLSSYLTLS